MAFLQTVKLGYFGKVPTTGDFVARNVDRGLRDTLDQWLQAGLLRSRNELGEDWLHSYLTAPVWRFLIGGAAGATAFGVMIPSVDKAGRYFPFIAVGQGLETFTIDDYKLLDGVLDEIETLTLTALDEDFDLENFGFQLANLNRKLPGRAAPKPTSLISDILKASQDDDIAGTLETLGQRDTSIWWTSGSELKRPERLEFRGMPDAAHYGGMLRDKDIFADLENKWRDLRGLALTQADNGSIEGNRRVAGLDVHFATHPGHRESKNCAFAQLHTETGGFIISDGRFGTQHNAMAARLVCTHLFSVLAKENLDAAEAEATRVTAFLKTKVKTDHQSLMPPLSFAMICQTEEAGRVRMVVAGEYVCLRIADGVEAQLFPVISTADDATTIRKVNSNQFVSFDARLSGNDVLVIASGAFAGARIKDRFSQAVSADADPASRVHAGLEAALLQGGSSNLAIGVAART